MSNNSSVSISIIIPVYNAERFLVQTIKSVLSQTLTNWELLLIDDGSTDNSKIICDEYSDLDERITVIHTKNKGVSNARNIGISNSRGKYIVFWDSDDICYMNYLESMYNIAEACDCDIVYSDAIVISESETECKTIRSTNNPHIYSEKDIYNIPDNFFYTVWGKIYKKELFVNNQIKFDTAIYRGEDMLVNYLVIIFCKLIVHDYTKYVNYRIHKGSLMRPTNQDNTLLTQSLHKFKEIVKFCQDRNIPETRLINRIKFDAANLVICDFLNTSLQTKKLYDKNLEILMNDDTLISFIKRNIKQFSHKIIFVIYILASSKNIVYRRLTYYYLKFIRIIRKI